MHPYLNGELARLHQQQLVREAAAHRLHRTAIPRARPLATAAVRRHVGLALIGVGRRLAGPDRSGATGPAGVPVTLR